MRHGQAKPLLPCALCLRATGFGMTRTARILCVGKVTVSRWYKANGVVINPLRNGVALKGTGARPRIGIKGAIRQMRNRVKRCLNKRPPSIAIFFPDGCDTVAQRFKWRYDNDTEFRIQHLLRRRIRKVIETGVKRGSSLELLGCTTTQFRDHIESLFAHGMSWDNQGVWHLDHVKPCAAFDLTKTDEQRACFHYTNYRPMWGADNISKGAWYKGVNHGRRWKPAVARVLEA